MDLEIVVLDVQGQIEAFALDGIREGGSDVKVERVAELVGF